eukprot:553498_1
MAKKKKQQPTIKMKTLHWKPISDKKIPGTIWEDITKLEDDLVKKTAAVAFFAPKKEKEEEKDTAEKEEKKQSEEREKSTLEELFAAKKTKRKKKKKGGGDGGDKKPKKEKKELIEIIDGKRSYNVNIGLSRFKMKNSDIKQAVLAMDEEVFNIDKLYKLISLAPTPEEVTQMQSYEGPENDLALCERFFNQFRSMDNVRERLSVWAYKMTFDEEYNDQKRKVDLLSDMASKIKESEGLKLTLASILACGNFINGGTKKGAKHGFELETLSKIGAYRTTDSTMSILGYIFKFLRAHYPQSLDWIDQMETLPQVIRIETDNLDSEITKMDKDLEKVKDLLQENKSDNEKDRFQTVMQEFYDASDKKIKQLQKDFNETITGVMDLAKFYGEKVKPSQFKLEEFFGIFNEFRITFVDNRDKILKIENDKQKEAKKAAAKKKRAMEMAALKEKKKKEKEKKKRERDARKKRKNAKKKVGFASAGGDAAGDSDKKRAKKKGKTDKMLDEMGDAHKYLAKLRKNRKQKSKGNLLVGAMGNRKKSMFFQDRRALVPQHEVDKLRNEANND